jgi:hypothetical protein
MILIILFLVIVLFLTKKKEDFTLNHVGGQGKYEKNKIEPLKRQQKFLTYLSSLNDIYKSKIKKLSKKEICNDKINEKIQIDAVRQVFNTPKNKMECIIKASEVCEFTDPNLYLSETTFPLGWIKDVELPKNVDLSCFNQNYDCCYNTL